MEGKRDKLHLEEAYANLITLPNCTTALMRITAEQVKNVPLRVSRNMGFANKNWILLESIVPGLWIVTGTKWRPVMTKKANVSTAGKE